MPEEAAGHLAAAKARLGLTRLQSVRVHHCAQVRAAAWQPWNSHQSCTLPCSVGGHAHLASCTGCTVRQCSARRQWLSVGPPSLAAACSQGQ